jgi:hypothetical protein
MRPYLENTQQKIGLVEWLKLKALSSNPSTVKKKTSIYEVIITLPLVFENSVY